MDAKKMPTVEFSNKLGTQSFFYYYIHWCVHMHMHVKITHRLNFTGQGPVNKMWPLTSSFQSHYDLEIWSVINTGQTI